MQHRGQFIFGAILVLLGVVALFSTVFRVDFGPLCFSIVLIGLGVWLVLRPRWFSPGSGARVSLLGELRRIGSWTVQNEEIWQGVGDIDLDLTGATIPTGETLIRIYTFVSDVKLTVPRTAGISVRAVGFVVDANLFGDHSNTFLTPIEAASPGYAETSQRVRVDLTGFVADLKVRQV